MKPGVFYKLKEDENLPRQKDGQPDIYIEKGEKRITFPPAKANEARTVQRMFSLDTEPACVYLVLFNTPVNVRSPRPPGGHAREKNGGGGGGGDPARSHTAAAHAGENAP